MLQLDLFFFSMAKQLSNPLYLFGILEESPAFVDWKNNAPAEFLNYRDQWMSRADNREYGDYPLSLNVEVTRKCNLACTFCWHRELDDDLKIDMSFDMFKAIVDESAKYNLPAIT